MFLSSTSNCGFFHCTNWLRRIISISSGSDGLQDGHLGLCGGKRRHLDTVIRIFFGTLSAFLEFFSIVACLPLVNRGFGFSGSLFCFLIANTKSLKYMMARILALSG